MRRLGLSPEFGAVRASAGTSEHEIHVMGSVLRGVRTS